jgi:tetratricopeptide (TPR) repeat protein
MLFFNKKTEKTINEYNKNNISLKDKISTSVQKITQDVSVSMKSTISDLSLMHQKSKNLLNTNFELGIFHLNKGNIKEAHFRFFLMSKIWPKFELGLYYYAYVLTLQKKYQKAQIVINKIFLLNHNPNSETLELNNKIAQYLENNNVSKT